MKHCPKCAAPFDGLAPFCLYCGYDAKEPLRPLLPDPAASDPLPTAAATPSVQLAAERSSDAGATRTDVAIPPKPTGRRLPRWALACAGAFAVAGLVTMVAIGRGRVDTQAPASPAAAVHTQAPASPAVAAPNHVPSALPVDEPIVESALLPTWVGARRATWGRDLSKTIAFQLTASNDVGVWMKRVQPILIVRCLSRTTDVFVATGSAASIEQQPDSHTVRIQFDDAEPVAQSWSDSVNSQELYAPDGVTLARRLARARTMRFGFTPYNSPPVIAAFDVRGFDQLVGLVAGTCGWRVDDSRPAEKRRTALD